VFLAILMVVGLVAAATPAAAAKNNTPAEPVAFTNHVAVESTPVAAPVAASEPDAESISLRPGKKAPDFQYQSYDAMWQHLHNVLQHGDVLLVFGASEADLRALERQREGFVDAGIVPMVVMEKGDREVWSLVRRIGLTYSLLADPKGAIGIQYGVFDKNVGRSRTAWFAIDVKGRVRQVGTEVPAQAWPVQVASALGRPVDGGTQTASTR
jgi:peroxiredoxin